MQEISYKAIGIVGAAFLFGFAVFVHELGHFIVAKMLGVGVRKFAIGFGPRIFAVTRGETEYSIRWIPLGGFVALKGMLEESEAKPDEPDATRPEGEEAGDKAITSDLDALRSKPPLARIAVFASGVTCNYLTAIACTALFLWYGVPKVIPFENMIERVPEETALYEMGWRSGDRIVADADGNPISDWQDVEIVLRPLFMGEDRPASATLAIERNGEQVFLQVTQDSIQASPYVFAPPMPARVGVVMPNSPADRARLIRDNYVPGETIRPMPVFEQMPREPLRQGDRIVAIDDEEVGSWREMQSILASRPDQPITMTIERGKGDERRFLKITTVLESAEDGRVGRLGIMSQGNLIADERDRLPFLHAVAAAPGTTIGVTTMLVRETVRFIAESTWEDTQRQLGGPMAIGIMAYQSARKGLTDYLQLFIAISIILAIMNILPIPILDGGYIAITAIEGLIGRPIPQKVLEPLLTIFMFLFIILFGLLFYNDIKNWIFRI